MRISAPKGPRDRRNEASEMVQTTVVTGVCSGGDCCENATSCTKIQKSIGKKEMVEAGDERHSSNTLTHYRLLIIAPFTHRVNRVDQSI